MVAVVTDGANSPQLSILGQRRRETIKRWKGQGYHHRGRRFDPPELRPIGLFQFHPVSLLIHRCKAFNAAALLVDGTQVGLGSC